MDLDILEIKYGNGSSGVIRWSGGGNRELVITIPLPRGLDEGDEALNRRITKIHGAAIAMDRELSGSTSGAPVARQTIVALCYEKLWGHGYGKEQVADIASRIADPLIAWLGSKANG